MSATLEKIEYYQARRCTDESLGDPGDCIVEVLKGETAVLHQSQVANGYVPLGEKLELVVELESHVPRM